MFKGITTRDLLAVMTVGAALLFNGISLSQGLPVEAATMTLAGAVVGYYFNPKQDGSQIVPATAADEEPLPKPFVPGSD